MNAASARSGRSNGLDTLRAAAITLVFLYHYHWFVNEKPSIGWISRAGWSGVDLFFVLSGYLIANQLFSGVAQGKPLSLAAFYARRALRTLPTYWVVLASYFLFPAFMGAASLPPLWKYLTFTVNFGLHGGPGFSHAWSLCIEEQFYLVLPIAMVVGLRYSLNRRHGWTAILCLLLIGMCSRAIMWWREGPELPDFDPHIYYATLCRFDEFLPGIAVALIKNFHRPIWERVTRHGHWTFGAGMAAVLTLYHLCNRYYYIEDVGFPFWMITTIYSSFALSFALLVVAALSPDSWLYRVRIPGAYHLALWSYSIYLSHKAVLIILARYLSPLGLSPTVQLLFIAVGAVAVGVSLHKLVEAPFLALRNRWVPTNAAFVPRRESAQTLPTA